MPTVTRPFDALRREPFDPSTTDGRGRLGPITEAEAVNARIAAFIATQVRAKAPAGRMPAQARADDPRLLQVGG